VTLLDEFEVVDPSVDLRIAYNTRALLPAKVKAFVEHAAEFFADLSAAEASSPDLKSRQ